MIIQIIIILSPLLHQPRMIRKKAFDHVIVGSGLLGSSVAYHLSKLTQGESSICIVERGSRTDYATRGNSQYSTGLITSSHKTALGRSMVEQTFTDLTDLATLGFDPHFIQMGCVEVDINDKRIFHPTISPSPIHQNDLTNVLHFDGWEDTFAAGNAVPSTFNDFVVSEQFARDGVVSPTDLADCFRNAAKAINPKLEIIFDADVVAATGDANSIDLTMADGTIVTGGKVVNAAGAWVDTLGLGSKIPDANGKGVPIGLMRADYWMLQAPRPIPKNTPLLTLPGAYIKPHGNQVELGTYRDQQLVYEHPDDHCDQEDSEMESIMSKIDLLKHFIPDIEEFRPMRYTSAKTTYTPDGMPVLGYVNQPDLPPMFAVSGCNGYGVTWSGGFGRIVSEALLGIKELPIEIDAKRFDEWSRQEVKDGAAEKRRTKFGIWKAET